MSSTAYGENWPSAWSTDSTFNADVVAAAATAGPSSTFANAGTAGSEVLDTELSISIAYGATITGGACTVYICRDNGNGGFESPANDQPYSFTVPAVASTTVHRTFTVPGEDVSRFVIYVLNPSGNSSVTVTLFYHQSQGQIG